MVAAWNKVVGVNDTVIHVGDFAFYDVNKCKGILSSLNGTKILVRGNHDAVAEKMLSAGFALVVDSLTLTCNGKKFYFTHYPMDPDTARLEILKDIGVDYHVHGHVHNKTNMYYGPSSINVSCEGLNYTPLPLGALISYHLMDSEKRTLPN